MILIENPEVYGWEASIRSMRNAMNSWSKIDSYWTHIEDPETEQTAKFQFFAGENDLALMKKLSHAGNDHAKFLRMITVTVDITAPLYWLKEMDTYKIGTVCNSCSTMHKIHAKEFTLDDFSHEHLGKEELDVLEAVIYALNWNREKFLVTNDKTYWWHMIQLLPSSYNQRRTYQLNYQVLKSMWPNRHAHKLDEWVEFMKWAETLPYFKEICIDPIEDKYPSRKI